jgi:hypothetical protein
MDHIAGPLGITLDVFEYVDLLKQRYRYEQVCAAPPATD